MIFARIINWIIIITFGGLIFFLSAFFFLGGLEELQALKENLLISFATRFGFVLIIVIGTSLIIYLVNLVIQRMQPDLMDKKYPKIIGLRSLLILSLFGLGGTCVFFFT